MGCFHASELPVLFGLNDIFGKVDDPMSVRVGKGMRRIWGDVKGIHEKAESY